MRLFGPIYKLIFFYPIHYWLLEVCETQRICPGVYDVTLRERDVCPTALHHARPGQVFEIHLMRVLQLLFFGNKFRVLFFLVGEQ
jgi:hypothetical protein